MTVSEGQQPIVDPEASLRAELTGAIGAAQIDIANAIAELARSGADSAALTNQGHALQQLQRTIGIANLGSLLALRTEVSAVTSSASALANQVIATATSTAAAHANLTPAERARASIETLNRDLFENGVLDPYLRFASPEDEEAYRKREREREAEIKRALASGTPEGDRRATVLARDQLRDAAAHGADRSPAFPAMEQQLLQAEGDLRPTTQKHEGHGSAVNTTLPSVAIQSEDDLGEAMAALKAAGVEVAGGQQPASGHGVATYASAGQPEMVRGA